METEQLLSREFGPIIDEFDLGAFASAIGIGTGSSPATLRHAKRLMAPPARIASDAIAPPPRKTKVAGGLVPTASPAEMTTQPPPPLSVHADDEDDTTTEATSPPSVLQPARAVSSSKQKGLRHFSLIVCEKLRQLQVTTYHVVSDELVIELTQQNGPTFLGQSGKKCEAKNIRRRVYDALNVLLAIGVIRKERKQITWVGLPSAEPLLDRQRLVAERDSARNAVAAKRGQLADLLKYYVGRRNLQERNRRSCNHADHQQRLYMPFGLVRAPKDGIVDAELRDNRRKVRVVSNKMFTLRDDKELLLKMGCAQVSPDDLVRICPKEIVPFYPQTCLSPRAVFGYPIPLRTDPVLLQE
ncbi:E2F/DP family winged-helix DNA-binding domain-containing protein [Plasmodiophora brassicae]